MADPPPVDVSAQPQPSGDLLQPLQPELPDLGLAGGLSGHPPQPADSGCTADHPLQSAESGHRPLADLNTNGDPRLSELPISSSTCEPLPVGMPATVSQSSSGSNAASKKTPSGRPSLVLLHRKIKKKKTSTSKSHPLQQLTKEEIFRRNLENLAPKSGVPEVVQTLQTIPADDASLAGEEDYDFSDDEEEEEEFDIESYHVDEKKRAELISLMEKYGVYDEEQLRLAICREWKQGKSLNYVAGNPLLSSESAPASPVLSPSRFTPHRSINPCLIRRRTLP